MGISQKPTEPVRLSSASDLVNLTRGTVLTINGEPYAVYRQSPEDGGYVDVVKRESEHRTRRVRIPFKSFITFEDGGIFFSPSSCSFGEKGVSNNYEEEDRVLKEAGY